MQYFSKRGYCQWQIMITKSVVNVTRRNLTSIARENANRLRVRAVVPTTLIVVFQGSAVC